MELMRSTIYYLREHETRKNPYCDIGENPTLRVQAGSRIPVSLNPLRLAQNMLVVDFVSTLITPSGSRLHE